MTWEEKIIKRLPWRHRERARRIITTLWPFVTRKRHVREVAQKVSDAATAARRDAEGELAKVREHMAPVIDKLLRVSVRHPQFRVVEPAPSEYFTHSMPSLDAEPVRYREKTLNTRPTYRIQFDIATDLVEHAFIHGNDEVAIREVARRAAYVVERELKTINFRRFAG